MQGWITEFHSRHLIPPLVSLLDRAARQDDGAFMTGLHERRCWCSTAQTDSGFVVDTNNTPGLRTRIYTADVWTLKTHQKYFKCVWLQEYELV